jgi:hypothetical protein
MHRRSNTGRCGPRYTSPVNGGVTTRHRLDPALLFDEDGNPEQRFLPVEVVVVPEGLSLSADETRIEVEDEEQYWYGAGQNRQVNSRCLSQFVRLADQPARQIYQFTRRWGLLGLCEHSKPATHRIEDRDDRERPVLLPYRGCTPAPAETIENWRMYSLRFRTFLDVAQRLHRGEPIADAGVWDLIGRPRGFVVRSGHSVRAQRKRFMRAVNLQLAASGVQPILNWNGPEPMIGFGVFGALRTSLFAALSMQLALTVADCKIAICSWCHRTYRPRRRSHSAQANYCTTCRESGVPARVRVQRLRDRRRVPSHPP